MHPPTPKELRKPELHAGDCEGTRHSMRAAQTYIYSYIQVHVQIGTYIV